jgi:plasmid maintenance system antidote protein VapI
MKPLGLSANKLALELHVQATRIEKIVHVQCMSAKETRRRGVIGRLPGGGRRVEPK